MRIDLLPGNVIQIVMRLHKYHSCEIWSVQEKDICQVDAVYDFFWFIYMHVPVK